MGEPLPRGTEYWILNTDPLLLGRLGTALGRLWDGSKSPESSMIARLGTVGRLGRGVYGYAQDVTDY